MLGKTASISNRAAGKLQKQIYRFRWQKTFTGSHCQVQSGSTGSLSGKSQVDRVTQQNIFIVKF